MKLRIWVEDNILSPDADTSIYADFMLTFDTTVPKMQQMATDLIAYAQNNYNYQGEKERGSEKSPTSGSFPDMSLPGEPRRAGL